MTLARLALKLKRREKVSTNIYKLLHLFPSKKLRVLSKPLMADTKRLYTHTPTLSHLSLSGKCNITE